VGQAGQYFIMITEKQGLKKCKFPGKLIAVSRGPQVEDYRLFMTSQKEFVSWKCRIKESTTAFTLINLDRFTFNVQTVASPQCTTLLLGTQKRATEGVQKQWKQLILDASGKFSHPILACGNREAPYRQIVNARVKYNLFCVGTL